MDPAVYALMLEHAAAQHDAEVLDGAIASLQVRPDGTVTAEIRIPGPPAP